MKRTKHFEERMISRGITETEVKNTHLFGVRIRDKVVLTSKTCRQVSTELDELARMLTNAAREGMAARLPDADAPAP
jgi:phosphohistidine phosphatase SixA